MTTPSDRYDLLWAKTDAEGRPHSLRGHLLDAAAVAELIWDEFLAPAAQRMFDGVADGRGRDLLVMVAALHDVGKATPAFQVKAGRGRFPEIDEARQRHGLPGCDVETATGMRWYHGPAGALIVGEYLRQQGIENLAWILPVVDGHHGRFGKSRSKVPRGRANDHGQGEWPSVQQGLVAEILREVDVDVSGWDVQRPSRGLQLAFAGLIVMADWIASSFPGIGLERMTLEVARDRARYAWDVLALRGGWSGLADVPEPFVPAEFFRKRFGFSPRPLQEAALRVVSELDDVGLLVIEAPMGEGKTEAAEAVVEYLARRRGFGGYLFCMPTQGTTDAMYSRVAHWSDGIDRSVSASLLHGKAALNEEWVERSAGVEFSDMYSGDEFGVDDDYGVSPKRGMITAASAWFRGRYRGLLSPAVVATVDQGLWAATRTRFVALRHAGLLGKIVVIDEVHAYDAYMSVFLDELVRWCARLGTPVILMSATLPPQVRSNLVSAWCRGAGREPPEQFGVEGYPVVLGLSRASEVSRGVEQYRPDLDVSVEVPGVAVDNATDVAVLARDLTESGGCALVVLNVVERAQQTWQQLREWDVPALLIHGRFTAAERARRTDQALRLFGSGDGRPERMVIVATQIAEQSFDVDADVLITDLAPMDLLLQRIGRLHRHSRNDTRRPESLRSPRVYVTGVLLDGALPRVPDAFTYIYRQWPLLESAAALRAGDATWRVPSQVPELVANAYSPDWQGPGEWMVAVKKARSEEDQERAGRTAVATTYRLDEDVETEKLDLGELHARASWANEGDHALIRDGIDTQEVIVVRWRDGEYVTLGGRRLQDHGQRASDPKIARELLGDTVRLREYLAKEIPPLPSWSSQPLLARMPVLVLDNAGPKKIGAWTVTYDDDLGLVVTR